MVANLEAAIIDEFGLVVAWILIQALFFIVQAVYIMQTGFVAPFFIPQPPTARLKRLRERVAYAVLYCAPGAGILALFVAAFIRRGGTLVTLREWLKTHVEPLVVIILLAGIGIRYLVRPSTLVNWGQERYPQLSAHNRAALLIVRLVAAMFVVFAFLILASLLHAG